MISEVRGHMRLTIEEAEKRFEELIDLAAQGEEIIIAKGKTAVAEIIPIRQGKFKHGILKDKLAGPAPDFLEPMSEEDLRLWEGRE